MTNVSLIDSSCDSSSPLDPCPLKENPMPELPPYRSSIPDLGSGELILIQSLLSREKAQPRLLQNYYAQSESQMGKMEALSIKRMEKVQENLQYAVACEGWGVFQTVGQGLVTIASIAMGISLLQKGDAALGLGLMFIGMLELFNLIYTRTRLWEDFAKQFSDDPAVQKDIVKYLPMIISALAAAANLAGASFAMDKNSADFGKTMTTGLLGIGLLCQGIASIADGVLQGKTTWADTVIERLLTEESLAHAVIGSINALLDNSLEISQQSAKVCNRYVRLNTQIKSKILQMR